MMLLRPLLVCYLVVDLPSTTPFGPGADSCCTDNCRLALTLEKYMIEYSNTRTIP